MVDSTLAKKREALLKGNPCHRTHRTVLILCNCLQLLLQLLVNYQTNLHNKSTNRPSLGCLRPITGESNKLGGFHRQPFSEHFLKVFIWSYLSKPFCHVLRHTFPPENPSQRHKPCKHWLKLNSIRNMGGVGCDGRSLSIPPQTLNCYAVTAELLVGNC